MRMVPRQLQMVGMTGNVPYYGGRFTPAQAFAAAHPARPPANTATLRCSEQLRALLHLADTGVITPEEFRTLRARVLGEPSS